MLRGGAVKIGDPMTIPDARNRWHVSAVRGDLVTLATVKDRMSVEIVVARASITERDGALHMALDAPQLIDGQWMQGTKVVDAPRRAAGAP